MWSEDDVDQVQCMTRAVELAAARTKTPGHPERVKERSEAFNSAGVCATEQCGRHSAYEMGAEAMRAACWEAIRAECEKYGYRGTMVEAAFKAAIEGAAP